MSIAEWGEAYPAKPAAADARLPAVCTCCSYLLVAGVSGLTIFSNSLHRKSLSCRAGNSNTVSSWLVEKHDDRKHQAAAHWLVTPSGRRRRGLKRTT